VGAWPPPVLRASSSDMQERNNVSLLYGIWREYEMTPDKTCSDLGHTGKGQFKICAMSSHFVLEKPNIKPDYEEIILPT